MKSFISKEQVKELLNEMDNEMSMQELSMWLKSKTDYQFVVVPKPFCDLAINIIEFLKTRDFLVGEKKALKTINSIKNTYL